MRLNKSLYGLRQSSTNWWNTIDPMHTYMVEVSSKSLKSDPCVYSCSTGGGIVI